MPGRRRLLRRRWSSSRGFLFKEGSVVQQSKVFKCNNKSFYERSKATGRGRGESKRLNGSAGKRSKICRKDGASRIPRGLGWNKEQRTVIRKQGGRQKDYEVVGLAVEARVAIRMELQGQQEVRHGMG